MGALVGTEHPGDDITLPWPPWSRAAKGIRTRTDTALLPTSAQPTRSDRQRGGPQPPRHLAPRPGPRPRCHPHRDHRRHL